MLCFQFAFQPGQVQPHAVPDLMVEGVAFFSKHPIVERNHILLHQNASDAADNHQRVLLHIVVDVPSVGKVVSV